MLAKHWVNLMNYVVRERPLALQPEWQVGKPSKWKFACQSDVSVRLGRKLALKSLEKRKKAGQAVKRPSYSAL
jgi:hypothetical protein